MPEEFDPLSISPADYDLTTGSEGQGEPEPEPAEAEPTTEDTTEPEAQAEEPEDADGVESDVDADLAELGFPALPPELAEKPDIAKRYHETQYGIQKVLRQQQAIKNDLMDLDTFVEGIKTPETTQDGFDFLVNYIRDVTGIDVTTKYRSGSNRQESTYEEDLPAGWDGFTLAQYEEAQELGCEFPSEYRTAKKLEARMEAKFKPYEQERELSRTQSQAQAFLDTEAPRVIGFLAKTENGWGVTKDMVAQAIKEFPNLKDDLPKAVKRTFPDEYASHKAAAVLKAQGTPGPELLTKGGSNSRGVVLEPLDYDADSTDLIHKIAANLEALGKS
jgi:hypothetical protein